MKKKITELTGCVLFIFSLFSLCINYDSMTAEIIGLSISIVTLLIAAVLITTHFKDGRWI